MATAVVASGRRNQADEQPQTARRLLACGNGCLAPKRDALAVPSYPTLIYTTFGAAYSNFAAPASGYPMAYGICYVLGCNYRNVTVTFVTGDLVAKQDFVYSVVFYALPGSSNLTAFPNALAAALPSTEPVSGSLVYGLTSTTLGAMPWLTAVYPASTYTDTALPPAPPLPAGTPLPPPARPAGRLPPSPPLVQPPPSRFTRPPSPPATASEVASFSACSLAALSGVEWARAHSLALGAAGTVLLVMLLCNLVAVGHLLRSGGGGGEEEDEDDKSGAAKRRRRRKSRRSRRYSSESESEAEGSEMAVRTRAPDSG